MRKKSKDKKAEFLINFEEKNTVDKNEANLKITQSIIDNKPRNNRKVTLSPGKKTLPTNLERTISSFCDNGFNSQHGFGFNTLHHKSNCGNVLGKFFKKEEENVKKLDFYEPDHVEDEYNLYHLKVNTSKKKQLVEENKNIQFLKELLPSLAGSKNLQTIDIEENIKKNKKFERTFNQGKEETWIAEVTTLETDIYELNKLKNSIVSKINKIQSAIDDLELNVRTTNSILKIEEDVVKRTSIFNSNKRLIDPTEREEILLKKRNYKLFVEQQGDKVSKNQARRSVLIEERNDLRNQMTEIQTRIQELQAEEKGLKKIMLVHYHKILNEGKDSRSEGLSWVVKAIWDLGSKVVLSYLPDFLDERAIQYIFFTAEKKMEYSKLEAILQSLKFYVKNSKPLDRRSSPFKPSSLNIHSFEPFLTNTKKFSRNEGLKRSASLATVQFKEITVKNEKQEPDIHVTCKQIEKIIELDDGIEKKGIEVMNTIKMYEEQMKLINQELRLLRKREIARIFKEFSSNDYARRFKSDLEKVFSAVIGEDHFENELFKHKREVKITEDKLHNLKFFTHMDVLTQQKKLQLEKENKFKSGVIKDLAGLKMQSL